MTSLLHATRPLYDLSLFAVILCMSLTGLFDPAGQKQAGAAEPFQLALPLDCTLGEDCWLVNYVDLDASGGKVDFRCGDYTYDGHKGTDISIRDLRHMGEGVAVLAATGGIVGGVRDGMPDVSVARIGRESLANRECGNGMVIKHEGGWETQYCHLRQGSVAVKSGDVVETGTHLGYVGQSGLAEFPHLHLSVRKDGAIMEPFTGASPVSGGPDCSTSAANGEDANRLWRPGVFPAGPPELTAIYNMGFAGSVPNAEAIRSGVLDGQNISPKSPVLALWVDLYRADAGDRIALRVAKPDGTALVEHAVVQEKNQARRWVFAGKKLKQNRWPAGTYRGEVSVSRKLADGTERVLRKRAELVIP